MRRKCYRECLNIFKSVISNDTKLKIVFPHLRDKKPRVVDPQSAQSLQLKINPSLTSVLPNAIMITSCCEMGH